MRRVLKKRYCVTVGTTLFLFLFAFVSSSLGQQSPARIMEGYPPSVQAKIVARNRQLTQTLRLSRSHSFFDFVKITTKWNPGQTVTVAFRGGNSDLCKKISQIANEWTNYGNIRFDFGPHSDQSQFRTWSLTDTNFSADIRVAFDDVGYWSLVGTESVDASMQVMPTNTSLNLEGFDIGLPYDWTAVVLHEFGHALGFMHEHQSPEGNCDLEFHWDDDLGYQPTTNSYGTYIEYIGQNGNVLRPGVYRYLEGPPNNWTKEVIDDNLRHIPPSSAYLVGPFDVHSIMMYTFDPFLYTNGTNSPCYTVENMELSSGDKAGVALVYPFAPHDIEAVSALRREFLMDAVSSPGTTPSLKKKYQMLLNAR